MHKLDLYYDKKRILRKSKRTHLHLKFAENWDELTIADLEFIIGLSFQSDMEISLKKTLLLHKLSKIPLGLFNDLDPVQIIQIYDCVEAFFENPELTNNLYSHISLSIFDKLRLTSNKLIGPGDAFGNLTVEEFIAAEDYYYDYLVNGFEEKDLNGLIAVLWREPVKGMKSSDPDFHGDFRQPFNSHHVNSRISKVAKLPTVKKLGMLYYYQGCRKMLIDLYSSLFESSTGSDSAQNRDTWLEMLTHLPNDKFGTIDEIGPMNLLTVLYFTDRIIADSKKAYFEKHSMKKWVQIIIDSLAFKCVVSIFDDDAHQIVSKKGWQILNAQNGTNSRVGKRYYMECQNCGHGADVSSICKLHPTAANPSFVRMGDDTKKCSHKTCNEPVYEFGMCFRHYMDGEI